MMQTTVALKGFLSLPRELRDIIYQYVLTIDEYIGPTKWHNPQTVCAPQLLRTSKTIYHEAAKVLYAENRFDFISYCTAIVCSFLDQIGPHNSVHIRHVRIEFPQFRFPFLGDVALTGDSIHFLAKLKNCCYNLRTLTVSRSSTDTVEHQLADLKNDEVAVAALKLVDTHLRAITSLQIDGTMTTASRQRHPPEPVPRPSRGSDITTFVTLPVRKASESMLSIVAELYTTWVDNAIREKMESHGWRLDLADRDWNLNWEDFHLHYGNMSFDGNDYDYDGEDRYVYDCDNDSDFWR